MLKVICLTKLTSHDLTECQIVYPGTIMCTSCVLKGHISWIYQIAMKVKAQHKHPIKSVVFTHIGIRSKNCRKIKGLERNFDK